MKYVLSAAQAYDGIFLTWHPDSRLYTVHATETVPWETPKVPADAALGPFSVLTAGVPATGRPQTVTDGITLHHITLHYKLHFNKSGNPNKEPTKGS
jgi:hypothetical protein